jgi:hypothetical protein
LCYVTRIATTESVKKTNENEQLISSRALSHPLKVLKSLYGSSENFVGKLRDNFNAESAEIRGGCKIVII